VTNEPDWLQNKNTTRSIDERSRKFWKACWYEGAGHNEKEGKDLAIWINMGWGPTVDGE